jgi:Fe2+ transport system protein FeoA
MLATRSILYQPVVLKEGTYPIQLFPAGSQVLIHGLKGERELCKRLESMGIQAGKTITILRNQTHSLLLKIGNTRIAFRLCDAVTLSGEQLTAGF